MQDVGRERVGVVLIHGVGETHAGWTSNHLMPKLEHWAAHEAVNISSDYDREHLQLRLPCKDGDVAVFVSSDSVFKDLCRALRRAELVDSDAFGSEADRLANRDFLLALLSETSRTMESDALQAELRRVGVPAIETYERASRVYAVRDPESSDPLKTWWSFSQLWRLKQRDVIFSELFWADMSKVGYTIPSRLFALIQLFLESPFILGQAMLMEVGGGALGLARRLIYFANWIMRWLIAGLNVAIFVPALLAILYFQIAKIWPFDAPGWLAGFIAVVLLLVAVGGYSMFGRLVHRKVGLADLALAGSFSSLAMLFLVIVAAVSADPDALGRPDNYLLIGVALLLAAWFLWSLITVIAVIVLSLLTLLRVLLPFVRWRQPLARPAAALSLSLLLGIIWKFVLALLGLFVITLLVPGAQMNESCGAGVPWAELFAGPAPTSCLLAHIKSVLLVVSMMNGAALVLVALAMLLVYGIRVALKAVFANQARAGRLRLPRLIASPLLVATLFVGAIVNFAAMYIFLGEGLEIVRNIRALLLVYVNTWNVAAATLGLLLFSFVVRRAVELSDGFIHIGRDLVDHQYDPDHKVMKRYLELGGMRRANEADVKAVRFRRRQRIQKRLEELIDDVIVGQRVERLVFVAHSQGTVIMHDYLIKALGERQQQLGKLKRIDVLTVGSPLSHLYRHYFNEYDQKDGANWGESSLIERIDTWINMWRVDDPIGQDIELPPRQIANVGLAPGGHVDYWREGAVCETLWRLIREQSLESAQAPPNMEPA